MESVAKKESKNMIKNMTRCTPDSFFHLRNSATRQTTVVAKLKARNRTIQGPRRVSAPGALLISPVSCARNSAATSVQVSATWMRMTALFL